PTATTDIYTLSLHDALPIYYFSTQRVTIEKPGQEDLPKKTVAKLKGISIQPRAMIPIKMPMKKSIIKMKTNHRLVGIHTYQPNLDRKSTRLNSSHVKISYAV